MIDHGRVIEEGTPADLIARGGRFAALLELEAAGWDWQTAPLTFGAFFWAGGNEQLA